MTFTLTRTTANFTRRVSFTILSDRALVSSADFCNATGAARDIGTVTTLITIARRDYRRLLSLGFTPLTLPAYPRA